MIVVDNVTKYYGERAAVSQLSFKINRGEVIGLLGLNGSGKTTTLRLLSGLLFPSSGRIEIAGVVMNDAPEQIRSKIGFLPETPPVYLEMTVYNYLRFVADLKGVTTNMGDAIAQALAAADLQDVSTQVIGTLSHGYTKRVGIAQAIVHKPALILLDEPTSGLDPMQVVHMRQLVRNLRQKHTVLISSHILGEIQQVCDRILVLHKGSIAAEGTEEQLAQQVAHNATLHVDIRGDKASLVNCLSKIRDVTRYTIDREHEGVVFATVELQGDRREELAKQLIAANLGLRRLENARLELEDIFLRLTGKNSQATDLVN